MRSVSGRNPCPVAVLPFTMVTKIREWVYAYVTLILSMVCSVSCLFCVFTFIWYLTFRGLYGFLINLQLYQPSDCDSDDDLTIDYAEYASNKRNSFFTRCRAQAKLIQQILRKNKSTRDKSSNEVSPKTNGDVPDPQTNGNSNHSHSNSSNSNHGVHVKNSSYVLEAYYDDNGHKIGEQIYLTNDSEGLEESYFQFKVNDVHHLKDLGHLSTSALVEEEPLNGAQGDNREDTADDNHDCNVNLDTTNNPESRNASCLVSQPPESTTSTCSIHSGNLSDVEDDRHTESDIGRFSTINGFSTNSRQNENEDSSFYSDHINCTCSTINESNDQEDETKDISVTISNHPSISSL